MHGSGEDGFEEEQSIGESTDRELRAVWTAKREGKPPSLVAMEMKTAGIF